MPCFSIQDANRAQVPRITGQAATADIYEDCGPGLANERPVGLAHQHKTDVQGAELIEVGVGVDVTVQRIGRAAMDQQQPPSRSLHFALNWPTRHERPLSVGEDARGIGVPVDVVTFFADDAGQQHRVVISLNCLKASGVDRIYYLRTRQITDGVSEKIDFGRAGLAKYVEALSERLDVAVRIRDESKRHKCRISRRSTDSSPARDAKDALENGFHDSASHLRPYEPPHNAWPSGS